MLNRLLFTVAATLLAASARAEVRLEIARDAVGRYERVDFRIDPGEEWERPFDPDVVDVAVEIQGPDGETRVLPAFWFQPYDHQVMERGGKPIDWMVPRGSPGWQARFAPQQVGPYTAFTTVRDARGIRRSAPVRLDVRPSRRDGFVRVSPRDPRFLELDSGKPLFLIGQNLAFIGDGQYFTLARVERMLPKLSANGANFLRVWTCCEDWALAIEARKSAWGRSWSWKPPFVDRPGEDRPGEDGSPRARCVQLGGVFPAAADVNTPHPIAVRPATRYVLRGKAFSQEPARLSIRCGWLQLDERLTGAAAGWYEFKGILETASNQRWLGQISLAVVGGGTVWLDDLSLREEAGGGELLWEAAVRDRVRGFYNPTDCYMLDRLVEAAEREGIYLQLCLITRDLYMDSLAEAGSEAYRQAVADARKLLRYAVARWGYSTQIAAWEYFNEINPNLPTDAFYEEVGVYLEQVDLYRHLRTTSTWSPSPKDWQHPRLDLSQTHHYIRPADKDSGHDEVAVVLERTHRMREAQAGLESLRPALIAEFGLAEDNWQRSQTMRKDRELVHFHNALWASAMSGAAGTAMFWWWELLDEMDAYAHYRPLAAFLEDMPLTTAGLEPFDRSVAGGEVRALGLQGPQTAICWLFDRRATWWQRVVESREPAERREVAIEIPELAAGTYRVTWWDTQVGKPIQESTVASAAGKLQLTAPPFTSDIACKVRPE